MAYYHYYLSRRVLYLLYWNHKKPSATTIGSKTSKESDHLTSFLPFSSYRDGGLVFKEAKEISKRCGNSKPPTVSSSTAVLWIRFLTDKEVEKNGFSIKVLPIRGKRCLL